MKPAVPLRTTPYQVRLSVCPLSTSTIFPVSSTRSLDVDDYLTSMFGSSPTVATSSHPIISLLNRLNLLPCRGLVKKSANIFLVGQGLTLIFPCFTLLATQKNSILMCLNLIEHDIFMFLEISLPPHCLATFFNISLGIPVLPESSHNKCFTADTYCYLPPTISLKFLNSSSVYSNYSPILLVGKH